MLMTKETALKLLSLEEGASEDDIEFQYIDFAMMNHPYRKSSTIKTTKLFKDISIAFKRLTQPKDEDWVDQFNSMDLFQSVYGDYSDSEFDSYDDDSDNDSDDYHGTSICRHFRCAFCCPFCDDDDYFLFTPEEYNAMQKKADKVAEELMKEEVEEKKKANQRKEKKSRRRVRRKSVKEPLDMNENESHSLRHKCPMQMAQDKNREILAEISQKNINNSCDSEKSKKQDFASETKKTNTKKTEDKSVKIPNGTNNCGKEINKQEEKSTVKYFKNWMNTSKIANPNKYDVLNIANDDSENKDSMMNKNQVKAKNSKHSSLKKFALKKNCSKKENIVPNLINQDAETISRQLASQGNQLAGNEEYAEAAKLFTHAIGLMNSEYRYYGNRSFCYDRMQEYEKALQDAEIAIQLSPSSAKGHFRKGRALAGLKRYTEAEKAYEEVLRLDKSCPDTKRQLYEIRLANLMEMGFEKELCEIALQKSSCVQFALDDLLTGNLMKPVAKEVYISDDNDSAIFNEEINENTPPQREKRNSVAEEIECKSLWIGNLAACVTERALENHFRKYGKINSVKALYDRHCAFINYASTDSAKRALNTSKVVEISGIKLLVRFPENNPQKAVIPDSTAQIFECRFWRSTGCVFGSHCRYQHIPENKGIDCQMVERTPYQSVGKC